MGIETRHLRMVKAVASCACRSSAVPRSDPHYSSGVGNHFSFLLANGSGQSTYGNSPT